MTEETPQNENNTFDVTVEIQNAINIIDHAAEQGAFRGWEAINQVYAVRSRLTAFVQMMQQALSDSQAQAEASAAATAELDALAADLDPNAASAEETSLDHEYAQEQARAEAEAADLAGQGFIEESTQAEVVVPDVEPNAEAEALRRQYEETLANLESLRQQIDQNPI